MKCLIVDDEPLAIKWLEKLIADIPSLQLGGSFSSAFQADNFLKSNPVDLMFLDIQMASLNGVDFLKSLVHRPLVIFVTAYPQYALDSYELDAIDYLLKPVRVERLLKSVNKAIDYLDLLEKSKAKDTLASIENDHIFVRAEKRFVKLFFDQILYIEGLKDYVVIKTTTKQKVITAMNIKTIYEKLPPSLFFRVSKSHIINTKQLASIDSHAVYIQDEAIAIGNSFRDEFYDKFVNQKIIKK
jgi:two-component system, LytTR family, response regulator